MKKNFILSLFAIGLLACSSLDLVAFVLTPTKAPSSPPPVATSQTQVPAITGTQPTPTFTYTPTLIGQKPSVTATVPPKITVTGTLPSTDAPEATPTLEGYLIKLPESSGFFSILISTPIIYYGGCALPKETRLGVRVSDPGQVKYVSFFIRLRSKSSGNDSGWDGGTVMQPVSDGLYNLTLNADDLHGDEVYKYYNDSWIEFQLVATDSRTIEVGRTEKIVDQLSLSPCPGE